MKELINALEQNIAQTEISLSVGKVTQAKQDLAKAALKLQKLIEVSPNCSNTSELIEKFKATSVKHIFAYVYSLSDALNTAIAQKNFLQAKKLYNNILDELNFLTEEYSHAVKESQHRSSTFIDFPKNYKYLALYAQQSLEKYHSEFILETMCVNFSNALNFTETQEKFGMNRHRTFSHSMASVNQHAESNEFNPLFS
ncbi:hypothetical protein [Legionella brunensis]|uniref:Uncharacterized protein n=1 Tax=Legionella brunensis TaxID=29422 RepID=A0A0W0SIJ3_9GAMM|nr:hypothetical protein [Legionella brunensis]KTC82989.1 hypothetical protein Lbru_1727 [Legionella brunensis]